MGFFEGLQEGAEAIDQELGGVSALHRSEKTSVETTVILTIYPQKNDPDQNIVDRIIDNDSIIWRILVIRDSRVKLRGTGQQSTLAILHVRIDQIALIEPKDTFIIDSVTWRVL